MPNVIKLIIKFPKKFVYTICFFVREYSELKSFCTVNNNKALALKGDFKNRFVYCRISLIIIVSLTQALTVIDIYKNCNKNKIDEH